MSVILNCREGNEPVADDDIIFEDFARLRLQGADGDEADGQR